MSTAEDHDAFLGFDTCSMDSLPSNEAGASPTSTAIVNLTRHPPEQWSTTARQAGRFRIPVVDSSGDYRLGEYNVLLFDGIPFHDPRRDVPCKDPHYSLLEPLLRMMTITFSRYKININYVSLRLSLEEVYV